MPGRGSSCFRQNGIQRVGWELWISMVSIFHSVSQMWSQRSYHYWEVPNLGESWFFKNMPLVLRAHPDVCWENVQLRWLNHPFGPWLFKVDPQFSYLPFTVTIVWCLGPHFFMVLYGHHVTTQFSAKQVEVFKSSGRNGVCMYICFVFIYLLIYLFLFVYSFIFIFM